MKKIFAVLMMALAVSGYAQKIKLLEGDLSPLKGQKAIKTEFTYDDLTVGNKKEADYVKDKKATYNEKEAGKGDKWEEAWTDDRKNRFEPKFRELFAKHSGMTTAEESAQYTLIFKTTSMEPGYNIGITRKSASIDAEVWIVESANKEKVIAKISVLNAPGAQFGGYDFDSGTRLQESYAKAGKEIGEFISKKTK
jgi:hypothetical protein